MQIWSAEIKELETLNTSIKGTFPELKKELEQLIETKDANIILVYSRRCLEVIITDLCEKELKRPRKTEPLKGIIDKLSHEEKVPSHIIVSMQYLNSLSTFGAHPKDFDSEQIKPVLSNLIIIIKWYLKYKESRKIVTIDAEEKAQYKEPREEVEKEIKKEIQAKHIRLTWSKLLSGVTILAILIIAVIIIYPKIFKRDTLEKLRSSGEKITVAVMPFRNMTNDSTWNVWQNGIQDILITYLSNSPEELKVRQIESINELIQGKGFTNYASITPSVANDISLKLDANILIYGSIKQAGSRIRLDAQLIDSKTEETFKSFEIDGPAREESIFQITDSLKRMINNFIAITKIGKELSPEFQPLASTNSSKAYRYLIYGENAFFKRDFPTAEKMYSQAIAIDSNFTIAIIKLAFTYRNLNLYDQAKKWCLMAYNKRDQIPIHQKIYVNYSYAVLFETPYEEIKYIKQSLEFDDQMPVDHYRLGESYFSLNQYDKAISEYEKALEIYKKWGSKPLWANNYTSLGATYHKTGQYKKEKKLYLKAEQDFPDDRVLTYRQAILLLNEGKTEDANEHIEKYKLIRKENSASEADITTSLALIYEEVGILNKAEEFWRQALTLEPENPAGMNGLAWFLINNDINIDEGLELIERALELSPDDSYYLDTKGWGLYKLGRYKEALELLEKSWELRPIYIHEIYLHIEEVKKALANQSK